MHLSYLYDAVSWVLLRWHQVFTALGVPVDSGLNWTLSIVFLVVTARLLLFRTVLRQLRHQRRLQVLQPKIMALRAKYHGDNAKLRRELLTLRQGEGFTPLAGVAPLALQWPVFIGLLHVLRHLAAAPSPTYQSAHPARLALYGFTKAQTLSAAKAKVFGGAPLAGRLPDAASTLAHLGADPMTTRAVIIVVVLLSAGATYLAQRWMTAAQTTEPDATLAQVQRLTRWLVPLSTLASGLFFPLGVLFYWLASNVWTAGQQAYLRRFHSADESSLSVGPSSTVTAMASWDDVRRIAWRCPRRRSRTVAVRPSGRSGQTIRLGKAALTLLDRIELVELEESIVEAWLARAPAKLAPTFLDQRSP